MCRAIQLPKGTKEEGGKHKGRWRRRRKSKKNAESKEVAKKPVISKAEELASHLANTEARVAPFDSCEAVSKRRMQIKKLCHGRVNTICADVGKIQKISLEIVGAMKAEKQRDDDFRERLIKKDPIALESMTLGREYFINLLAREVRVRVEAEGFNGARGDGFPLAAFVSKVASEIPEFIPTMEAYIYDACPLALPASLGKETSNEDFSEKLGMKKNKDGGYESFERFLQRTEGLISFMANVMSSHPEEHMLFGGHKGALQWLERFLEQLPEEPGQLPLFVAPILHAFLAGAGHMLAHLHTEEFDKLLKLITDDAILRLDEGPIGAPSAHRLKECVEDGMKGFEENLPSKALAHFYNNGKEAPPPPPPRQPHQSHYGSALYESFRPVGSLPYGSTEYGSLPYGSTEYGTSQYGSPEYGSVPYGTSPYGSSPYGSSSYGTPLYNDFSHKKIDLAPKQPVSRSRRIISVKSTWNKPVQRID